MIISTWNIRGLNKPFKQKELRAFLLNQKNYFTGCLETRIKPRSEMKIKKKFDKEWKIYSDEAVANNGMIWLFWKDNMVQVQIIGSTSQLVHCKVKDKGSSFSSYVTFVYGMNKLNERK